MYYLFSDLENTQFKFNNSPLITNPKVFPSLCKVTSTVLKMRPDPCTAKKK